MTWRTECWGKVEFSKEQDWGRGRHLTQIIFNMGHVFVPQVAEQELSRATRLHQYQSV